MKNMINISLDGAKVSALKMYLNIKNSSLDEELSRYAEQLYGKIVPQNVRDFIDMTEKQQTAKKPKSTAAKPTNQP
ncbi:MAG: DUF6103 family protein [Oscillospiraceae bacterium]|nr:DUF6103 family protein [Oscillospiraceae bacterium]